jgi:type IV conjugative transfer system protein TraL
MPRFVDAQPQFFIFDLDEFMVFAVCMMAGIVMRELVLSVFIGYGIVKLFGIWKSRRLEGALMHLAYRTFNTPLNKVFDNGAVREIIQ